VHLNLQAIKQRVSALNSTATGCANVLYFFMTFIDSSSTATF